MIIFLTVIGGLTLIVGVLWLIAFLFDDQGGFTGLEGLFIVGLTFVLGHPIISTLIVLTVLIGGGILIGTKIN